MSLNPQNCFIPSIDIVKDDQLADFITFNSDAWNFSIDTHEALNIGSHSITVIATIPLETDESEDVNMSIAFSFVITVEDPCNETNLSFITIKDMQASATE